jgi:hypothetical protein
MLAARTNTSKELGRAAADQELEQYLVRQRPFHAMLICVCGVWFAFNSSACRVHACKL